MENTKQCVGLSDVYRSTRLSLSLGLETKLSKKNVLKEDEKLALFQLYDLYPDLLTPAAANSGLNDVLMDVVRQRDWTLFSPGDGKLDTDKLKVF